MNAKTMLLCFSVSTSALLLLGGCQTAGPKSEVVISESAMNDFFGFLKPFSHDLICKRRAKKGLIDYQECLSMFQNGSDDSSVLEYQDTSEDDISEDSDLLTENETEE